MESGNSNYRVLLDLEIQKFDTVSNADNTIDQKSGSLLGFEIAIIVFYLSIFKSNLESIKNFESFIGIIILIISIIIFINITWPCIYSFASIRLKPNSEYFKKDENSLLRQLISNTQLSLQKNKKVLEIKILKYKIALILLILGALLLILSKLPKFYV